MQQDAEPAVLLLREELGAVLFREEQQGARAVTVAGQGISASGQAVCGERYGRAAAVLDGEEETRALRTREEADGSLLLRLFLFGMDGVFKEIAEDEREIDFRGEGGGKVDPSLDGDVLLARLPHIDGERRIDQGIAGEVLDARRIDLPAHPLDETHGGIIFAARDEVGEHLRIVSEVMAHDGEARLLFLQGARILADRVHARQEREISFRRCCLLEDVLKAAPCGESDEHAADER